MAHLMWSNVINGVTKIEHQKLLYNLLLHVFYSLMNILEDILTTCQGMLQLMYHVDNTEQ